VVITYLSLIAACFVFARRFAAAGRRGWAAFSKLIGALFLATWTSLFALQGARAASIACPSRSRSRCIDAVFGYERAVAATRGTKRSSVPG